MSYSYVGYQSLFYILPGIAVCGLFYKGIQPKFSLTAIEIQYQFR